MVVTTSGGNLVQSGLADGNARSFYSPRFQTIGLSVNTPMYYTSDQKNSGRTHFNFGSVNQHARGGPVYSLSYDAGEDRDVVLTWYRDALTAMKWDLDKEALKSGYVAATDGSGNMVHIAVTNSALKGARCNFMIQYKLRQRSV